MTELTLEELAELEQMLAVVPRSLADAVAFRDACYLQSPALLAMARELIRIRSAIEHCAKHTGGRFPINVEELVETAKMFKWFDPSPPATPVAELKGGEG